MANGRRTATDCLFHSPSSFLSVPCHMAHFCGSHEFIVSGMPHHWSCYLLTYHGPRVSLLWSEKTVEFLWGYTVENGRGINFLVICAVYKRICADGNCKMYLWISYLRCTNLLFTCTIAYTNSTKLAQMVHKPYKPSTNETQTVQNPVFHQFSNFRFVRVIVSPCCPPPLPPQGAGPRPCMHCTVAWITRSKCIGGLALPCAFLGQVYGPQWP